MAYCDTPRPRTYSVPVDEVPFAEKLAMFDDPRFQQCFYIVLPDEEPFPPISSEK